jgi:choline dehydrogenase
MAVVDSHLRVRGVEGLRVADASIMPQPNRGHTMAPITYVGEMAAQIISSEIRRP